jgi:hypothetical protein
MDGAAYPEGRAGDSRDKIELIQQQFLENVPG